MWLAQVVQAQPAKAILPGTSATLAPCLCAHELPVSRRARIRFRLRLSRLPEALVQVEAAAWQSSSAARRWMPMNGEDCRSRLVLGVSLAMTSARWFAPRKHRMQLHSY